YCVEPTDPGWNASHRQWNAGLNDGFALSNASSNDPSGSRAMGYYDQTDLPFYYSLASTFATSDRYFASLLGPSYPNRMFAAAGTSFGIITTSASKLAPAGVPNLYRELTDSGVAWKNYYESVSNVILFPDYFTALSQTAPGHFGSMKQLLSD